jgi:DNA/RNA endonuclease YhcR with UshA esterase domain
VGDIIKFKALRRENSLYCLSCSIKIPRRSLENSICAPKEGIIKVHGQVKEVKIYKNGFGLANITYRNCSILLKLRKSLNIAIAENQTITAFGYYTTYRGKPALEVQSREDICLENCS